MEHSLQKGAFNAVNTCLGVKPEDRVVIIGDTRTWEVDEAVANEAKKITREVLLLKIEDYGMRPLKEFPQKLKDQIIRFKPTVSFYAAQGEVGELPVFRSKLMNFLIYELKCRHGHMISITKEVMEQGMCVDYEKVSAISQKIYDFVHTAKSIHITAPNGTDFTATFRDDWKWVKVDGRIYEPGKFSNLPEGEVFTTPVAVDGIVVCDELGDYFPEEYGVLKKQVTIHMKDGYAWDVSCEDRILEEKVKHYLFTGSFCNRVGEFAFGTNIGLTKLIGNFLQDEKFPGIHIAFGHSYPEETGADWDAERHLDVIPMKVTIEVDGKLLMKDGKFLLG